jgi:hypothetical protein
VSGYFSSGSLSEASDGAFALNKRFAMPMTKFNLSPSKDGLPVIVAASTSVAFSHICATWN